jgi:bifunctional non-homologous end joining protein LigD
MLARSGDLPFGEGWRFEPKLDGFRCLVCTHGRFRARSRRGWDMTTLLPKLIGAIPDNVQLDGEIVAWDDEGHPDFHRLSARMLHGETGIWVSYMVFDLLASEGAPTTRLPYNRRREFLEQLDLSTTSAVQLVPTFTEGEALFKVMCQRGLEGVVAKREVDRYRPGDRGWVKIKNRATRRFAEELAGARRKPR